MAVELVTPAAFATPDDLTGELTGHVEVLSAESFLYDLGRRGPYGRDRLTEHYRTSRAEGNPMGVATLAALRGCSSMVEPQLPKLMTGVRFSSPARFRS